MMRANPLFSLFLFAAVLLAAVSPSAGVAAQTWTPADLTAALESGDAPRVVDVRRTHAYRRGHIPGAINLPLRLLQVRSLPPLGRVLVYGDGLGLDTGAEAAAVLEERTDWEVFVLDGGYAGWKTTGGLTTEPPGLHREDLPAITYQQLMRADRSNYLVVDLRAGDSSGGANPAGLEDDPVADFARELGLPRTRNDPVRMMNARTGGGGGAAPASAGAQPTLLLIDSGDGSAEDAARRMRARGFHNVVILVGGEEIIRHGGRSGKKRSAVHYTPKGDGS